MQEDDSYHLSTSAGKMRMRATQACILCRKKKIRCDGTKPQCKNCQEAYLQCDYTERKKRGPRKGYVQLLEERLVQLERRLTKTGEDGERLGEDSLSNTKKRLTDSAARAGPNRLLKSEEGAPNEDDLPSHDVVHHLVDLFFVNINSVFPLVHRATLKKEIDDGTVSRPLLWSVMAIAARFSDHPQIKTNPPYWAGERFAMKAISMIDATLLDPTLANLQFWGIMSCLEYGRASGSRAWIYGGLAARICQELGLNKEETLSAPILAQDGTVDAAAMALRRRIFWSCLCIDKFASAGTNRPQYFSKMDCDAKPPTAADSRILSDATQCYSYKRHAVTDDSLFGVTQHYLRLIEVFGEVNKAISRAKSDGNTVNWPPLANFSALDDALRAWKEGLPDRFQFSPINLMRHTEKSSQNYLNIWLAAHAVWCTTMMVLHRGSLAYSGVDPSSVTGATYEAIQTSIETCKSCVAMAMEVFSSMRDLSGVNVLPYMGYSCYIFATVLMTSTFSKDAESCRKSRNALSILCSMIDGLTPLWPMCERLAATTRELVATQHRLHVDKRPLDTRPDTGRMDGYAHPSHARQHLPSASLAHTDSLATATTTAVPIHTHPPTNMLYSPASNAAYPTMSSSPGYAPFQTAPHALSQPPPPLSILAETYPNAVGNGEFDFNHYDFLYDSGLFGQIMFDVSKPANPSNAYAALAPLPSSSSSSSSTFSYPTAFSPALARSYPKAMWDS